MSVAAELTHARPARSRRATRRLLELQDRGRLVGRRAGVERDDGRRASLLAARARAARPGHRPQARERPPRPPPRRRHVVELVGGPARPLDHDRVVRRAEDGRRRRGRRDARVHPPRRRRSDAAGLHEVLPRAARRVAVAGHPHRARRADPRCRRARRSPSTTSPAGRARPSCRCRSSRRFVPCVPRASTCGDRRAATARRRRPAHRRAPPPRDRHGRAMGAGAAGGRRRLGRHPAAVGLVDPHARRARPGLRRPVPPPRGRGLERLPRRGRTTACGPRRASRPSGTRPSRSSRSAPAVCPPTTRSS